MAWLMPLLTAAGAGGAASGAGAAGGGVLSKLFGAGKGMAAQGMAKPQGATPPLSPGLAVPPDGKLLSMIFGGQ